MICKLCGEDNELRNSHVIPEFLYKSIYDEKHRLTLRSTDSTINNMLLQKGIRERLLCDNCELKISKWERYASVVLNGKCKLEFIENKTINAVIFKGVEYAQFKLFQMSILWRASIATDAFFKDVKLGRHEEELRKRIYCEEPGGVEEYGCIMIGVVEGGDIITDLIISPGRFRVMGHIVYKFTFGGFYWLYFVTSHSVPNEVRKAFLEREYMQIQFKEMSKTPHIIDLARKLTITGRNF